MRTDTTDDLLAAYSTGRDPALREAVILRHLGLVTRLARRFTSRGAELDDLVQVGCVGLIKALDRYDPTLGVPFGAFAFPTIVGEIQRFYRDRADLIRFPRRLLALRSRRIAVAERLTQELGRIPTASDLAAAMPDEEPAALAEASQLQRPVRLTDEDNRFTGDETTPHLAAGREDEELSRVEDRTAVRQVLSRLSQRERILLHLRFYEALSQSQTAARMGVSQMHVCRLEHRALDKLRRVLAS